LGKARGMLGQAADEAALSPECDERPRQDLTSQIFS
jgi:hypothetical protein